VLIGIIMAGVVGYFIYFPIQRIYFFEKCPHFPSGFDCMFFPKFLFYVPLPAALLGSVIANFIFDYWSSRKR